MRELICWDMVSVDGFFEGPEHDISWFAFDEELERYSLDTQRSASALLFGRVTYEMMAAYWPSESGDIADFMNSTPKVVVSNTLREADWHPTMIVRGEDVAGEIAKLKREPGGDIFVFGSADLTSSLLRYGLVDELRIGVNPILLGDGNRMFKRGGSRQSLRLVTSTALRSGLVILHYRPAKDWP
jgi:dihydrofolate reductase